MAKVTVSPFVLEYLMYLFYSCFQSEVTADASHSHSTNTPT